MEKTAPNGEPLEKNSRWKENFSQILIVFFIIANGPVHEYFVPGLNVYIYYLISIFVFLVINELINKKKNQRFDFRQMFKTLGFVALAFLIFYNVTNLMMSVSDAVPESVSSWFPLILAAGVILFLIVYGIHFAEKHSKP